MSALNHRALVVALPTLADIFQTPLTRIQWALLGYDLVLIGLVLTLGRIGDLFGHRRIYVGGYAVFVSASLLCGLSQSIGQMIAFRAVQGIGGAMLVSNARAIISIVSPPAQRGRALGFTSMAYHVGFLAGPTLGGFLIDTVGWRWNFFINIPVGIAALLLASRALKGLDEPRKSVRLDLRGALLLLFTNTAFLYAMNEIPHRGLTHPLIVTLLPLASLTLALFIRTEMSVAAPVLNLALFRNRLFSVALLSHFFINTTQAAVSFILPFYLQNLRGFTPSQMGWIIIANSLVIVVVAPVAGWLSDRFGSRLLCTAGASLLLIGQLFIATLGADATVPAIIWPLLLSGLGWAVFNAPNQSAILGSVARDQAGGAAGVTVTAGRVGSAAGVVVVATLFTYLLTASGLSPAEIESVERWSLLPRPFLRSFELSVYAVNVFAFLAILFSAARGTERK
jgi:EmrB/QacA subfamily drug resistance transporter